MIELQFIQKDPHWSKWLRENAGERMDAFCIAAMIGGRPTQIFNPARQKVHLARYDVVRQIIDGIKAKSVISLPSGTGYGEHYLGYKSGGRKVVGLEFNSKAVNYANIYHKLPNVKFYQQDGTKPRDIKRAECVVSLEGIEHVPEEHAHKFIDNFYTWTKKHFILSFPENWGANAHRGGHHLWNPTHDIIKDMIKGKFKLLHTWLMDGDANVFTGETLKEMYGQKLKAPCTIILCEKI